MNTTIAFEQACNETRRETGRWLGKAIGLVRERDAVTFGTSNGCGRVRA